jgi:hypothetical protein
MIEPTRFAPTAFPVDRALMIEQIPGRYHQGRYHHARIVISSEQPCMIRNLVCYAIMQHTVLHDKSKRKLRASLCNIWSFMKVIKANSAYSLAHFAGIYRCEVGD